MSPSLVLLRLALGTQPAAAPDAPADPEWSLRWQAPPECPTDDVVQAEIDDLSDGASSSVSATIDARVEVVPEGFRLQLDVATGSGATHHEMVADRCELLARATAIVTAVAIAPLATLPELRPEPRVAAPVAVAPARTAAPVRTPVPERTPKRRRATLRVGLRADGILEVGTLPGPAAGGGGISAALLGPRWRAEAAGVIMAPGTAHSQRVPSATARLWRGGATVLGCGVPSWTLPPSRSARSKPRPRAADPLRLELPLCGGVEFGAVIGEGAGATVDPQRSTEFWSAAVLAPRLAVVPRRFIAVMLGVAGVVPFRRPTYVLGDEEVFRAQPFALRVQLGLEVRLPRGP